jgi:hypothetical protein
MQFGALGERVEGHGCLLDRHVADAPIDLDRALCLKDELLGKLRVWPLSFFRMATGMPFWLAGALAPRTSE